MQTDRLVDDEAYFTFENAPATAAIRKQLTSNKFTNKFTTITINCVFRFILAALMTCIALGWLCVSVCVRYFCFIQFVRSLVLCITCSLVIQVHWSFRSLCTCIGAQRSRKKRIPRMAQNAHTKILLKMSF